jgi:hypothetical protein
MAVILGGVALVASKPRAPLRRLGQTPPVECEERC